MVELNPRTVQQVAILAQIPRDALDMIRALSHPVVHLATMPDDGADDDAERILHEWDDALDRSIRRAAHYANLLITITDLFNARVPK